MSGVTESRQSGTFAVAFLHFPRLCPRRYLFARADTSFCRGALVLITTALFLPETFAPEILKMKAKGLS
jgi:hypothetical protein